MLLVDDILLFPLRGIFWIAREIENAAHQQMANELQSTRTQLSELYMMLETGRITEEEFEAQEACLLNRLDQLEGEEQDERLQKLEEQAGDDSGAKENAGEASFTDGPGEEERESDDPDEQP